MPDLADPLLQRVEGCDMNPSKPDLQFGLNMRTWVLVFVVFLLTLIAGLVYVAR